MKKIIVATFIFLQLVSGCATGLKVVIKPREDELTGLRAMTRDLANRHWYGRMAVMKTNVSDQIKRIIYGLENNTLNTEQAARATAQAQITLKRMDEIAKNPANEDWLQTGDSGSVGEFREYTVLKQLLDGLYAGAGSK